MEEWKLGDSNKSMIYILPMLGFKDHQFCSKYQMPQSQFRNCFVGDNIKGISNKIILVYEYSATNLYLNFVFTLKKHELFEDLYELDDKHSAFIFKVPEAHLNDYNKIIKGEYSQISKQYKEHIVSFHDLAVESETFGVLYRTGQRRDQLEEKINGGLPKFQWTKIPPFTELEEPFDSIEVLQPESIKNHSQA